MQSKREISKKLIENIEQKFFIERKSLVFEINVIFIFQ